ncbi:hypothetical protein GCM10022409_45850 [Hymenobacter glaciei]|uniref:Uncharacterized protein n=1 Tax=Hymenobacter glaciei TaxID=877209 RepID=A0ABP7UXF6_9BACT
MASPCVASPDDADGFAPGNWTTPRRTPAGLAALVELCGSHIDLLLGRRTYDAWSGFWPTVADGPMANGLNAATDYVATHRPDSLEGIRAVKSTNGPGLLTTGRAKQTARS